MRTQVTPYPDFSVKRQCVAHRPILEWQSKVGITAYLQDDDISRPETLTPELEVEPEPSLLIIGEDLGISADHHHHH